MSTYPWTAHYEEGVPATVEIPQVPLRQFLADAAAQYPNKTALNMTLRYLPFGLKIQSTTTYRQLEEQSNRFAAGLIALGVQKGDRIAVMLPNLPQSVVAFFGVLKAGAIVVNTNPTYTPRELEHQLQDSGAETVIMLSGLYERLTQIRTQTDVKRVIITDVSASLRWPFAWLVDRQMRQRGMMKPLAIAPDLYRYRDLVDSTAPLPTVESTADDVVLFQYTGGTTGKPKAAMLTNHNLVSNVRQVGAWFSKAEAGEEKVLAAIPFFHVYGMTAAMLFAVDQGAEMVIMPDPRNIEMVMKIIEREAITIYPGVPAMYIAINNHPKVQQYNLRSIKSCFSGASSLPVHVATKFEELTGGQLVEGYGLTECSPIVTGNPIFGERRVGTIGVPMPNTEVAVVALTPDANGLYPLLAQGEEGELVVRGPQVMKGYWNHTDEDQVIIDADGWFHTGDIGTMDNDGYFTIVDRKKDLIIASGYNIVPREVEEVLFSHEKILDASVAGVPDPKRGETVKAFIVLKPGQQAEVDEIRAFCKQQLAPYKVPTAVEFRTELPKTQAGKVLRRQLVEEEKKRIAENG